MDFIRKRPFLTIFGVVAVLAAIVAGVLYYLDARHYEVTDDAFVAARQFAVGPKVGGYVVDVAVTDNQIVTAGDLLFQIETIDYEIALAQAQARRKEAEDSVSNFDAQISAQTAQIDQAIAQVAAAKASVDFAQQQFARATQLRQSGSGTVQTEQQTQSTLSTGQADFARAQAAVIAARKQVSVLEAQRASAVASLSDAKAQRDQAALNLRYTSVKAAQAGRVTMLTGAKGQLVQPGQTLTMFVPDPLWITANFKETQITDMRPGQPVDVVIDAYPGRKLRGHVDSIQGGSGTAFSLLPAENATGNYVKVVQRVPVKIVLDEPTPDGVVIGPGLSVSPKVKVR